MVVAALVQNASTPTFGAMLFRLVENGLLP
jgi:hypothetical protein